MDFLSALDALREGKKVKLPEWTGHWFMEGDQIKVLTGNCTVLDTPYLEDYKNRTDWEVTDGLRDFGGAVKALKAGKRVARKGWNGKNMFLFLLPAGTVPTKAIHDPALRQVIESEVGGETFEALGSIRMFTADKKILTGWLASQTDILAEDWVVLI